MLIRLGVVLAGLLLAVAGLRLLVPPVELEMRVAPAAASCHPASADWERKFAPGFSTGFGALAADMLWLQTYDSWVARDLERTQSGLRLVVAANPQPLVFWLSGARMTAYDMPEWRIAKIGRSIVSSATFRRINREQARQALAWLDRAQDFHPHAPEIFVERALIQLYRLHDAAAAAESFQRAAEQPGAPDYAARLQRLLLQRLERATARRQPPRA